MVKKLVRVEQLLPLIYSPITIIDGSRKYINLEKNDINLLNYCSYEVIGIRCIEGNITLSVKKHR